MADVRGYLLRRLFRIAPLFYTAIVLDLLIGEWQPDLAAKLLMNLTFSFGLANPGSTSLLTGGWSIGIEMVFYVVFPAVLVIAAGSLRRLLAITAVAVVLTVTFVNFVLVGQSSMTLDLWATYTQPVAFFGYFASGILLGEAYVRCQRLKGHAASVAVALLALAPFFIVAPDTTVGLLTGWTGLTFMVCTLLFVAAVAFMREPLGSTLSFAKWAGEVSYPVYLLHPIVYGFLTRNLTMSTWARIVTAVLLTLLLSTVINRAIERPARDYGRRLAIP